MDEGGWGVDRPPGIDEVPPASSAQTDGDEGFPARVTALDRRAFAEEVFDRHAEEIYRYVLAWTGDSTVAYDLTAQVLRGAVVRVEQLAEPETDLEARLIALAREAVARRSEAPESSAATRNAGAFAASEPVPLLLAAVANLDDTRREVVILRQLLGRSAEDAARLLAFDPPVVDELERDACASVWRRVNRAPQTKSVTTWEALNVGAALRQGAPTWLAPPDRAVIGRLREQLLGDLDPDRERAATALAGGRRRLLSDLADFAMRRRWLLAGGVVSATAGIVIALAMGGPPGRSSSCGPPTCLVSTTAGGVADTAASVPPPQAEQPGALPSSSTRTGVSSGLPTLTSGGSVTSGPVATTTTPRGTKPAPSTTRPRQATTTTKPAPSTTTAPTTTQPPITTAPPTTITTSGTP
jgi:DNA-directed RNA polymerase specialized sigma24 family protein